MISRPAIAEARRWIAKAKLSDERALEELESAMNGYGLEGWAKRMMAEQILALIRLTAEKTFSGSGGE